VPVIAAIAQPIENRHPIRVAAHYLPINQKVLHARCCGRRDKRKACRPINAIASKQPDAGNVQPHHHAEAVELISCSAVTPVGGLSALDGKQGWMKPGGNFGRTRYRMALDL
jgi:hypothetical protein